MADKFQPLESIEVLCRFCQKVLPATLDRSIAGSGKNVDRDGTFEYSCQKCFHSSCFRGVDLPARPEEPAEGVAPAPVPPPESVEYTPAATYVIGQIVTHKKYKDSGPVVDKEPGAPTRILIDFKKKGLTKLVEGL